LAAEPAPDRDSCVYLVVNEWYGTFDILATYTGLEAAEAHRDDPNTVRMYGSDVTIYELGVRSRKQLRKPHVRRVPRDTAPPQETST
jgi:hypothetical protein